MAKEKGKNAGAGERRHLFGSTEKSDFILNMDASGVQRLCSRFVIISMLAVTLLAIPAYYTQNAGGYYKNGSTRYLSDNFIFFTAALVMLTGWIGLMIFNIARKKGQVSIKSNKLLAVPFAILVMSLVSCFAAYDMLVSVMGMMGRHEGFLTVCAGFGFFAVTSAVSDEKRRVSVCDAVVGVGAFHAVAGILQHIPAVSAVMDNFFEYLYIRPGMTPQADGEVYYEGGASLMAGIYTRGRAATGFLLTPHALAAVLSIAFALALAGAAFDSSGKRRVLYGLAALPMSAAACFTETLTALLGISVGAAAVLIAVLFKAFRKDTGSKGVLAGLIPIACAAAICAGLLTAGGVKQYDEYIIFTDCYVLKSTGQPQRTEKSDNSGIYHYLFVDAEFTVSKNVLTGVGCDNTCYIEESSTDRYYNEYMDMAAQRGVVVMGLYVVFVLISLWKALKAAAGFIKGKNSWMAAASLAAAAGYLTQAWINTTWVTSNYFLFIVLGFAWSFEIMGTKKSGKDKK